MPRASIRLPAALKRIPPLPQVTGRALDLIRDVSSQRTELAHLLSLDQGMTGLFLQMVNSAYYGLPRRITSLDEAIGFLGYGRVKEVIVALSARRLLSRPVPAYMLDRAMLWKHSVAVAAGSAWIGRRRLISPHSELYVAGLLHDVGKIALDLMLDHEAQWDDGELDDEEIWTNVEREIIGHDHAEVGAVIVRSWNLPDRVVEAVACHHTPAEAKIDPAFTAAVHVANVAALMAGISLGVDGLRYEFSQAAVERLEWDEGDMIAVMEEMHDAVAGAEDTLGIKQPTHA